DIVQLGAGSHHSLALTADGTVLATGDNSHGQCDVDGWEDIVSIAAGSTHSLGLRRDGTVVATGDNTHGQCATDEWEDVGVLCQPPAPL
ncbi:MAG: hypothetical protein Q7T71_15445, partial [Herbiconiux sp.]|nr:hypothetical protein [Herbiconiux sp.]